MERDRRREGKEVKRMGVLFSQFLVGNTSENNEFTLFAPIRSNFEFLFFRSHCKRHEIKGRQH